MRVTETACADLEHGAAQGGQVGPGVGEQQHGSRGRHDIGDLAPRSLSRGEGRAQRRLEGEHGVEVGDLQQQALVAGRQQVDGHPRRGAGRHGAGSTNGVMVTPAASSRARTARAISTAPGVSPWVHTDRAGSATSEPSTASTVPSVTIPSTRAATSAGSCRRARGCERGTSRPSAAYPRSAKASATTGSPAEVATRSSTDPGCPRSGERGVVGGDGVDDRPGLHLVDRGRGVERAVRLHVGDPGARHPAHRLQRTELVEHVGGEVGGIHVDAAATEAGEVAVADLGADDHPALGRHGHGAADGARVAGVEAARHVGAGDDVEHRRVVAEHPGAERLAEVGVEVDPHGHGTNASAATGSPPATPPLSARDASTFPPAGRLNFLARSRNLHLRTGTEVVRT